VPSAKLLSGIRQAGSARASATCEHIDDQDRVVAVGGSHLRDASNP
jgi:hypothetical protein